MAANLGPPLGRIKGAAFRELLNYVGEQLGAPRMRALVDGIEGLDPTRPGLGILAGSWYPAALVHAIVDRLTAGMTPPQQDELARQAAMYAVKRTLSGVYKLLFNALASPERYGRHVQRLWSSYYDSGTVVHAMEPLRHVTTTRNFLSHHPFICQMNFWGGITLYEAMGCVNVRARVIECRTHGAEACVAEYTWTAVK